MLPLYDMNGNEPLKSWYTIPLFLPANYPKQKNICNQFIVIVPNQVGASDSTITWSRIHLDLLEEWQHRWINLGGRQLGCIGYDRDQLELGGFCLLTLDVMARARHVALCCCWAQI